MEGGGRFVSLFHFNIQHESVDKVGPEIRTCSDSRPCQSYNEAVCQLNDATLLEDGDHTIKIF